ncbi:MAG: hypothetical protein JSR39_10165 [Verrucomicrobia bacterium]|nr:hypothetical protein [Verrucomicrobiota bacterium]
MKKFIGYLTRLFMLIPAVCLADQWPTPPSEISTSGVNASEQAVAIDPNGNVVAVWIENGFVKSSFTPIPGTWSSPPDTVSNAGASSPLVVMDLNGSATAIWVESGVIKAATKPLNGSWPLTPDTLSVNPASSPNLAIDATGNIVAVWLESGVVMSATKLFSGSWSATPDTVSASGASFPQVAVGNDGTVIAVWQADLSGTSTVYAAMKTISGSWGAQQSISTANVNSAYPQISINSSGNAIAVWYRYDLFSGIYSNVILQGASKLNAAAWNAPVDISSAGKRNPADLVSKVVYSDSNMALAAWTNSFDNSLFSSEWSAYENGVWSDPEALIELNLAAYDVDATIDSKGNAYVSWMGYNSADSSLLLLGSVNSLKSILNRFWVTWVLSNGGNNAFPSQATNTSGSALYGAIVWMNSSEGSTNVIQALTEALPIVSPPSSLSVIAQTNDFGLVTETFNIFSWTASASPNIIGYLIYRNGVFMSSVGSNVLQYIDHNRKAGETNTYSVAAYDNCGYQSDFVDFIFTN